jgi:hypothetical protein
MGQDQRATSKRIGGAGNSKKEEETERCWKKTDYRSHQTPVSSYQGGTEKGYIAGIEEGESESIATVTARDLANVTQSRLYSIATLAAVFIFSGSQAHEQTIESLIIGPRRGNLWVTVSVSEPAR